MRNRTAFLFSAVAFGILPTPATGVPASADLGACFKKQAAVEPFNGIVLAQNGITLFEEAVGTSDAASAKPFSRQTVIRLASVQKVMTIVAVGQLVDAGKVTLDAPVSRYVAGLPPEFGAITIEQLIRHRSGVTPLTRITPREGQVLRTAARASDLLPLVTAEPLRFPPGSKEEYSNGGFFLLGAVIESVSGKSYGDFLQDSLFAPLGMTQTSLKSDSNTASRMTRIPPMPGQPLYPTPQPMVGGPQFGGTPAGDGVSSAADLLKLGQALLGDGLLSATVKAALFPRRGEEWRIGQSGGSIGVNTDFAVYPDSGWVVVTASNFDPPGGELMGQVIRNAALGKGCTPMSGKDRPSPFQTGSGHAPVRT